ncbi:MAG TPA: response regulator [Zoogloea sp.]|uniref:GGDEF domain-containing response regulator n=1 Tax=Zoogloea sp. TaxID=49181 RepID=UPI002B67CC16|nr:response regulator [Zoogloea sp.]HOB47452.1 response regulator [Zoogloea sp.]HQA11818.1 response regulator [Zoogloea sp.]HQE40584.1 response regulator [Zoogloea sp.]
MSDHSDQSLPRILIIDDSRMVRASIIRHVRDRFDVREEVDGEAGWQTLLVDPTIQAVITDIGMPRLDGYGLLERIRSSRLSRINTLPVAVISGDDEPEVRVKAKSAGATDFISKSIGNIELLARLEALTQLARTQRDLEESRAALATASPVDPASGLATPSYLHYHASQELSLARRHNGELSVMVVEIDQFDSVVTRYGAHVAQLINRKLSKILATRLRKEDTVAELATGRFAVVSPSTSMSGAGAFALRLCSAIDQIVMTYREERIRIHLTVGLATSEAGRMQTVSHLIGVALQRVASGQAAGGNRVIGDRGELTPEMMPAPPKPPVSIDQILQQLRASGADAELRKQLPDAIRTLLPLLELIESELPSGLPLAALARVVEAGSGIAVHKYE